MLKLIKIHFTALLVIKHGDLIQFVQYYSNLSFKDAIKKINYDFNLNLNYGKLSNEQIEEIKKRKQKRKEKQKKYNDKMLKLCKEILFYENLYKLLKSQINPYNWEEIEEKCSTLTIKLHFLNEEFDKLNVKNIDF